MMEQEKKATVSTPQNTALATQAPPPPPLPPAKRTGWFTRETRLAIVVLASFLAVAAGVYAVKVVFKSKPPAEPTEVVQGPPVEPRLDLPPQLTRSTALEPSPAPEVKSPVAKAPFGVEAPKIQDLEPTPIVLPNDMDPPLVLSPSEKLKKDPLVIDPLIIDVPSARKDEFTRKDNVKSDLPKLDLPPVIDVPEAKNAVIRVGASDPKKDPPPMIEVPLIPEPPPVIDVLPKKDPPVIDRPLILDPPAKKDPLKKDPPLILDPPTKKDPPAIDPPLILDPPMKKDVPVIDIDLKKDPPAIVPRKVDGPATGNDYDEDLHPFKKEDTYRSISKQYYNSDAYSIALQRYNRDHPGQADYVRIPPIWLLEKKYAADIASTSARSTSNAPPVAVDLAARNEQVYTVGDNGEMLADIAKKTLGSEEAWKRIWDLNSQLNPAKMIPGGTRLRLPTGS